MKGAHYFGVVVVLAIVVLVWWRRCERERMENGECVQRCPMDSAGCQKGYFLCINSCGPDLTQKSIPTPKGSLPQRGAQPVECVRACKKRAAECRYRFLKCADACGQLYVS